MMYTEVNVVDSARSIANSLSHLVNTVADRIHKIKYKYEHDKKCDLHKR